MLRREGWYNLQEEGTGPWFHVLWYLCSFPTPIMDPSIFASCRILLLKLLLPILSKHTVNISEAVLYRACLRQSSNATLPRHAKTVFRHSQPLQQNIRGSNFQRASKCYSTWVLSVWHARKHVRGCVASSNFGAYKAHETRKASRGEAKTFHVRCDCPTHATPAYRGMPWVGSTPLHDEARHW